MKELKEPSAFFYATLKVDVTEDYNPLVYFISNIFDSYLVLSWLIKDNSICTGTGYLESITDEKLQVYRNLTRFALTSLKDDNNRKDIFTVRELKALAKFMDMFINLPEQNAFGGDFSKTKPDRKTNRVSRALFYFQGIRSSDYLPLKIAEYMTCFESLFLKSDKELSHQLAERVAFFIEEDPAKRVETYKLLKKAYNIRSVTLHGNIEKSSFERLKDVALKLDEILRRSILKIISDRNLLEGFNDEKNFNEKMLKMIFNNSNL